MRLTSELLWWLPRPLPSMRANTLYLVLIAVLVLSAPSANARSHRSALKPMHVSAPIFQMQKAGRQRSGAQRVGRTARAAKPQTHLAAARLPQAGARPRKQKKQAAAPTSRRRSQALLHVKMRNNRPRPTPAPATGETPVPSEPSLPAVHVTHDRKQHLSAPPDPSSDKATPEAASTHDQASLSSAARPVSVISIIRPTAEKPQLPTIEEQATTPQVLPALSYRRGRLVMPAALRGTHEILVHQNAMADQDGLARIQDDDDLARLRGSKELVPLPMNAALQTDERLPIDRRYCRPWTAQFLNTLARAHYDKFHTPLQVNSAVRTVEFQRRLQRTNGNAAPSGGETASPHLTGQAVDLAKHGLSITEIAWLREYLLPLVQEGKVDVEEEFQQACFHISVYRGYAPKAVAKPLLAQSPHATGGTLAAVIQ